MDSKLTKKPKEKIAPAAARAATVISGLDALPERPFIGVSTTMNV